MRKNMLMSLAVGVGWIAACAPALAQANAPAIVSTTNAAAVISATADLNQVAAKTDAVLIYLPGKDGATPSTVAAALKNTMNTIEKQGSKCGLFALKVGSDDYNNLTAKITSPAVLVMVKGRGCNIVSGDLTEAKLLQSYVAASRAGGCCSGSGCCP